MYYVLQTISYCSLHLQIPYNAHTQATATEDRPRLFKLSVIELNHIYILQVYICHIPFFGA